MKKLLLFGTLITILFFSIACSVTEPSIGETPVYVTYSINGTHGISHENSGDDEISVLGLSGLLADDQHVIDAEVIDAIDGEIISPSMINTEDSFLSINGSSQKPLKVFSTNDNDAGTAIDIINLNDPDVDDTLGRITIFGGEDGTIPYGYWDIRCQGTSPVYSYMSWTTKSGGVSNQAMTLSAGGTLEVDLGYGTFDEYDDARLLRDAIQNDNPELLVDAGVYKVKYKLDEVGNITNETDGYMVSIQDMMKLNSGGIYQLLDYIEKLEYRVQILENKLK